MPHPLVEQISEYLDDTATGILLYGSWARNDAGAESDVDILTLSEVSVDNTHTETPDSISLSRYTSAQLQSAGRTLFGMHLARDGVIIYDEQGQLKEILDGFSAPDPTRLLRRLQEFSSIFDIPAFQLAEYQAGLCRLARYLLRSAIYSAALAEGTPCFSIQELSERFADPLLKTILSSHPGVYPEPSAAVLEDLTSRLERIVGNAPPNKFGTIHALIVGYWDADPEMAYLATLALSSKDSLPYSEVPKVIL
ncbi:nucleotidyltransferase domain-containing protein [Mycobacteroides abscessus]